MLMKLVKATLSSHDYWPATAEIKLVPSELELLSGVPNTRVHYSSSVRLSHHEDPQMGMYPNSP